MEQESKLTFTQRYGKLIIAAIAFIVASVFGCVLVDPFKPDPPVVTLTVAPPSPTITPSPTSFVSPVETPPSPIDTPVPPTATMTATPEPTTTPTVAPTPTDDPLIWVIGKG